MAFCGKCGTQVNEGTAFCSRCGAPVAAAAAPKAHPFLRCRTHRRGRPWRRMSRDCSVTCSAFITGIIFLVLEPYKNDRFVRFHAFQSIFFSVALTVFWIVWTNLFWLIPFGFLMTLFGLIGMLVWLAVLGLWLFLMFKAYNGERFMIPVIGDLAAKQAG